MRKKEFVSAVLIIPAILLSVVPQLSGYKVSGKTYLTDGSEADVQAACSAARDNGAITVEIPNGTYQWRGNLVITHSLALAGQSATGVTIENHLTSGSMIQATSSAKGHINIYWLNFLQVGDDQGAGYALSCDRAEPSNYTVLVHDCTFNSGSVFVYMVHVGANGVIFWKDKFIGDGPHDPKALGGIEFGCEKYGYTSSWNTPDTYGTLDTTGLANSYVENCAFYDAPSSCSDFMDNARVVLRYCTIQNASFMSHGQDTAPYGVRQIELYNNKFNYFGTGKGPSGNEYPMDMNDWIMFRGGAGLIAKNAMDQLAWNRSSINLSVYSINQRCRIGCQTAYPAARQTGQGWSASSRATYGHPVVAQDGSGDVTEGVYIWANTGTGTTAPHYVNLDPLTSDECHNGKLLSEFLQEGRDYFVGRAKPNWVPYQYPHPLHSAFAVGQ